MYSLKNKVTYWTSNSPIPDPSVSLSRITPVDGILNYFDSSDSVCTQSLASRDKGIVAKQVLGKESGTKQITILLLVIIL